MSLTTSGTFTYSQSIIQIATRAARQMSAIQEGETLTSPMLADMVTALNGMTKAYSADQIHVWCEQEYILFLQPGQAQYQLGPAPPDYFCLYNNFTQLSLSQTAATGASMIVVPFSAAVTNGANVGIQLDAGTNFWTTGTILSTSPTSMTVGLASPLPSQATSGALVFSYAVPGIRPLRVPHNGGRRYLYSTRIQTPLIGMSRTDYDYLPNLYNTGVVTQFFFDPQTGNQAYATGSPVALMNVWPEPVDYTNAMRFIGQRPIQDAGSAINLLDFPAEWIQALTWNLALEMAPEFDVPENKMSVIEKRAGYWLGMAKAWDREPEPWLLGYATEPGYR